MRNICLDYTSPAIQMQKKRLTIRFLSKSDAHSALFQRFTISTLKSASESPALLAASKIASKPSFINDTNVSI